MGGPSTCGLAGRCGGCPEHARDLAHARRDKVDRLAQLLDEVGEAGGAELARRASLTTPAALAFREHLDARWDGTHLGLLALPPAQGIADMAACPLLVPALAAWLSELRRHPLPIARASLRLRVHGAARGLWVDCANADVKQLLDEQAWLLALAGAALIELGPKSRRVVLEDGRASLAAPALAPWSTTFVAPGERAVSLYMSVRAFSQPGAQPNRVLVRAVRGALRGSRHVLELGAGAGNLTLPLLADGLRVRAVELDTAPLERSAREAGLLGGLELAAASFERQGELTALLGGVDAVLADPPRQGLGRFVDGLARLSRGLRPARLVYVSCHPEALAHDARRLAALGYRLGALSGVDQFPWTRHAEWVAGFALA